MKQPLSAIIVGAGASGLTMAYRLKKSAITDFVLLERSDRVGGTWRDNDYPGAACDNMTVIYSLSWARNKSWSRKYATHPELHAYFHRTAVDYGLMPFIRFNTTVVSARWDDQDLLWHVGVSDGTDLTARQLIFATGQLNKPKYPSIPGMAEFAGKSVHSWSWNGSKGYRGKNVAVIGTGASSIQIVPAIADDVKSMVLFQRSPAWTIARNDRPYTRRELFLHKHMPFYNLLVRWYSFWIAELGFSAWIPGTWMSKKMESMARSHLEASVADPQLRAKLTPDYPIGCKRLLVTDHFLPAIQKSNVELVTEGIARIDAHGIHTRDRRYFEVDTIVYGTGFDSHNFMLPVDVRGRHGVSLAQTWGNAPSGYMGLTVPEFPNMHVLYGPNSGSGHNSVLFMVETQVGYVMRCIAALKSAGQRAMAPSQQAMTRYNKTLQEKLALTSFSAGCGSWYVNADGKVTNQWSSRMSAYWWLARRVDLSDYTFFAPESAGGEAEQAVSGAKGQRLALVGTSHK